ncbi:PAS domain S-box protein [Natrialba swarupiae]|nr:PAS domain S-box protein [Natrialba swarupiae]
MRSTRRERYALEQSRRRDQRLPAADVVGDDDIWTRLYPDDDYREEILRSVEEILQGRKPSNRSRRRSKPGTGQSVSSRGTHAIVDSEGERQGSVAVGRDVTERRERERQCGVRTSDSTSSATS